jgi:hypothetical protein
LDLDLITRTRSSSDGPTCTARVRTAAGRSPGIGFRGGAAQVSPDFTVNGAPEAKSGGAWVWDKLRETSKPPRAKAGLGKDSGDAHDDGGGSTRRRIASVRRSGLRGG